MRKKTEGLAWVFKYYVIVLQQIWQVFRVTYNIIAEPLTAAKYTIGIISHP